jgi:hypothetical protein
LLIVLLDFRIPKANGAHYAPSSGANQTGILFEAMFVRPEWALQGFRRVDLAEWARRCPNRCRADATTPAVAPNKPPLMLILSSKLADSAAICL